MVQLSAQAHIISAHCRGRPCLGGLPGTGASLPVRLVFVPSHPVQRSFEVLGGRS